MLTAFRPSPLLSRPDTPALLAFEDQPNRPILDDDAQLETAAAIYGELYPPIRTPHGDLRPIVQN